MNGVYINTSQNVTIDYNLADVGSRILARLLDWFFMMIYLIVFYLLYFTIMQSNEEIFQFLDKNNGAWGLTLFGLISLPVFFYSLWAPYFMQGYTFGKKILNIKIVKVDGSEAGFGTYFVRWLLNIVDNMFYNIVGLVVMASTRRRQRVADLVAGTVVISTKQTVKVDQTILAQIAEDYQPRFSQVLQLSDKDVQIIKSSMQRARMQSDYALVKRLRNKIEEVISEYHPEMSDIEYVETVIKDYQYFSQQ